MALFPALIRRFVRDQRGTMTMEFLLWVPVICFWMIASVAWFDAYLSRNQAAKVAYTVSDILSRQEEVSSTFLFQIDTLQAGLLTRADGTSAMRLSSLQLTSGGMEVRWSCSNDPEFPALTDGTIPLDALPDMDEMETVVLTELTVPWSRFGWVVGLEDTTWAFQVPTRPRFTPALEMTDSC